MFMRTLVWGAFVGGAGGGAGSLIRGRFVEGVVSDACSVVAMLLLLLSVVGVVGVDC